TSERKGAPMSTLTTNPTLKARDELLAARKKAVEKLAALWPSGAGSPPPHRAEAQMEVLAELDEKIAAAELALFTATAEAHNATIDTRLPDRAKLARALLPQTQHLLAAALELHALDGATGGLVGRAA